MKSGGKAMTEKSNDLSRPDLVAATGATALVGGALAATGTPASAASSNEICRMDAVTLVQKVRTKQLSASEITEAVLERMDKLLLLMLEAVQADLVSPSA
jgi:hypothetical protein